MAVWLSVGISPRDRAALGRKLWGCLADVLVAVLGVVDRWLGPVCVFFLLDKRVVTRVIAPPSFFVSLFCSPAMTSKKKIEELEGSLNSLAGDFEGFRGDFANMQQMLKVLVDRATADEQAAARAKETEEEAKVAEEAGVSPGLGVDVGEVSKFSFCEARPPCFHFR